MRSKLNVIDTRYNLILMLIVQSHVYYKIFYNKRILWFEGLLFRFFAKITGFINNSIFCAFWYLTDPILFVHPVKMYI